MKKKILYAEDEPFLSRIVSDNLVANGYEVVTALNGDMALKLFKENNFDLCLIDIMMPLKDGYHLVEDIRKLNSLMPVIFLSAKSLDEDVVKGFRSGGNDYLKKPFSMAELFVRIESLLTRFDRTSADQIQDKWYEFAGCRLDAINQQLHTSRQIFDLSYKEAMLLEMLLKNKNKVLERQKALIEIWGNDNFYNANSMNVFLTHLRKMLKEEQAVQILNIRGIGYKLLC